MAALQHSPFGSVDSGFANTPPAPAQFPAQPSQNRDAGTHQRTYQACIPCRRRKVRCDLGSPDNPHDPPCQRCRRESKECFFSATRRKKKGDADAVDDDEEEEQEEYIVKTGRKRVRADVEEPTPRPRTPGGSVGQTQPLRRPGPARSLQYDDEDIKASEQLTAILQGNEVHGGHDALKLLMKAAGVGGRSNSMTSAERPNSHGPSPSSLPSAMSPIMEKAPSGNRGPSASLNRSDAIHTGPLPRDMTSPNTIPTDSPFYKPALKAWSRFRFVRSGWFTAKEGIAYVGYFYKYLSPLTPITLPDFCGLESHERLLTNEPMLAITILLIASRHMRLEGPGAVTRPFTIHQKLWQYLQGMIDRVTWGQEQFGGGFCGAGSQPGCDVNPLTRKGLRTLGTVESLMLLTEWHPRAMHFPPDEADDELMAPASPLPTPDPEIEEGRGIGGQRMDSWLEPCWRSDRMCWMLLGMAMSLAFEIGVFDKTEWQRHAYSANGQPMSASEMAVYDKRRGNVRDLLLVYVTLTSGRLGLTSMLPGNYSKPEDSELFKTLPGEHTTIQETVLQFWLRLAAIMRDGNQTIFANKTFTRDLIKNGSYKIILEKFRLPLSDWRRDFQDCAVIPKYMRYMLGIEFEYCRVYLNALSLQAVAERCANEFPQVNDPPMDLSRPALTSTNGIRPDVAIAPQTLHKWLGGDRVYMNEVRDAACNLLTIVVEGLYPGGYLRHAPVRSYFRIISVAIMLLKSFSLGASEADVSDSLKLMDKTVAALRTCIVDDVHVASRFADLLDVLVQNLKPRLVRVSADGRDTRSRKQSVRSTPVAGQEMGTANGTIHGYDQRPYLSSTPQAQWSYATNHPLHGVSDDTYDLMGTHEHSVMPPPSFGLPSPANVSAPMSAVRATASSAYPATTYTNNNNVNGFANSAYNGGTPDAWSTGADSIQDWFALPLDPIIGLSGADVDQTMYGPQVSGQDMLELLLLGNNNGLM